MTFIRANFEPATYDAFHSVLIMSLSGISIQTRRHRTIATCLRHKEKFSENILINKKIKQLQARDNTLCSLTIPTPNQGSF